MEKITDSLRQKLITIGLQYGFPISIVEDSVQDTLIKIHNNMQYYDDSIGSFGAWTRIILYRTIIDKIKYNKKVVADYDLSEMYWVNPATNQTKSKIEVDHIMYYFNKIKMLYKKPMILRMLGHNYKEISEILNVPIGTTKSRILRGRKELKEVLNNIN